VDVVVVAAAAAEDSDSELVLVESGVAFAVVEDGVALAAGVGVGDEVRVGDWEEGMVCIG
jgi:hypothetical protein